MKSKWVVVDLFAEKRAERDKAAQAAYEAHQAYDRAMKAYERCEKRIIGPGNRRAGRNGCMSEVAGYREASNTSRELEKESRRLNAELNALIDAHYARD
jgi:hypothetical protein